MTKTIDIYGNEVKPLVSWAFCLEGGAHPSIETAENWALARRNYRRNLRINHGRYTTESEVISKRA